MQPFCFCRRFSWAEHRDLRLLFGGRWPLCWVLDLFTLQRSLCLHRSPGTPEHFSVVSPQMGGFVPPSESKRTKPLHLPRPSSKTRELKERKRRKSQDENLFSLVLFFIYLQYIFGFAKDPTASIIRHMYIQNVITAEQSTALSWLVTEAVAITKNL